MRPATDRGATHGAGTAWYGRVARVPRRPARRGTGGPDLEVVGNKPARMPRQARCPVRGARRGQAGRAPGAPATL
jgi:hypothetical protein